MSGSDDNPLNNGTPLQMFGLPAAIADQPAILANVLAQQTLADAINKAWSVASPELKEAFARSVFVWCVSYLHTGAAPAALLAHTLLESFFSNTGGVFEFISAERKSELADAVARRVIHLMKSTDLSWDDKDIVRRAVLSAAQRELAASAPELSVSAIGGTPLDPPE